MIIDTAGMQHRELNIQIRSAIEAGVTEIELQNVIGQRYIAAGVRQAPAITINGIPGNDLGAFMDGPVIRINGNGQDGLGNTMSSGTIVVDGDVRDLVGHSMRGGRIFVRGDVGYRVGVHMKSYEEQFPVIVVGGRAGDFTGEYMAGGVIVILNLYGGDEPVVGNLVATGMHGGTIYIRGEVEEHKLGREAKVLPLEPHDEALLAGLIDEFSGHFPDVPVTFRSDEFCKLLPLSHRPYGRLYAY